SKYEDLLKIYLDEKLPVGSDLMMGLPGQTYQSYANDLQFFFDRKTLVNTSTTTALINSPISDPEYIKAYDIKIDSDGFIESSFSFTKEDLKKMIILHLAYDFLIKLGVL